MEFYQQLLLTIINLLLLFGSAELSLEKKLIKFLLERYACFGTVSRPVFNYSQTIDVYYGLALIQILDLDEKNQILTTNCWSRFGWNDVLLRWDPKDYGGIQTVRVPVSQIWTPDIILYNFADDRLEWYRNASAVVEHNGNVMWIPQAIFKSSCSIDIKNFPFDTQNCSMKFGSWTYDGFSLDMKFYENLTEIDLNDYVPSNEWHVVAHPAKKNVIYYQCCNEPYPDLTFTLILRRKIAFYNYILVLPCVLLSSLTLVIFWIPPESPAKMILGINIFVAFFVSLLLLSESTPPASSEIPFIGAYYCFNMCMITLSTFLSIIVINLHFRGEKKIRVPYAIRRVFIDFLARVFCMRNELVVEEPPSRRIQRHESEQLMQDGRQKRRNRPDQENRFQMKDFQRPRDLPLENHRDHTGNHTGYFAGSSVDITFSQNSGRLAIEPNYLGTPEPVPSLYSHTVAAEVKEIRRYLKQLMGRLHLKEERSKLMLEWKIVALVLDRLFFFLYLVTSLGSLMMIFPRTA